MRFLAALTATKQKESVSNRQKEAKVMTKSERNYLIGLFFVMVGVFMPWIRLMEYEMLGSVAKLSVSGTIAGDKTIIGWVILITALLMVSLFVIKPRYQDIERAAAVHKFFLAFIFILLIFGGIMPAVSEHMVRPHVGILSILVGIIVTYFSVEAVVTDSSI